MLGTSRRRSAMMPATCERVGDVRLARRAALPLVHLAPRTRRRALDHVDARGGMVAADAVDQLGDRHAPHRRGALDDARAPAPRASAGRSRHQIVARRGRGSRPRRCRGSAARSEASRAWISRSASRVVAALAARRSASARTSSDASRKTRSAGTPASSAMNGGEAPLEHRVARAPPGAASGRRGRGRSSGRVSARRTYSSSESPAAVGLAAEDVAGVDVLEPELRRDEPRDGRLAAPGKAGDRDQHPAIIAGSTRRSARSGSAGKRTNPACGCVADRAALRRQVVRAPRVVVALPPAPELGEPVLVEEHPARRAPHHLRPVGHATIQQHQLGRSHLEGARRIERRRLGAPPAAARPVAEDQVEVRVGHVLRVAGAEATVERDA